jgi:hypothetical protein
MCPCCSHPIQRHHRSLQGLVSQVHQSRTFRPKSRVPNTVESNQKRGRSDKCKVQKDSVCPPICSKADLCHVRPLDSHPVPKHRLRSRRSARKLDDLRGFMKIVAPSPIKTASRAGRQASSSAVREGCKESHAQRNQHTDAEIAPSGERTSSKAAFAHQQQIAREAAPVKFKRVRRPTDPARRQDLCQVRPLDSHPVPCTPSPSLTNKLYMSEASIIVSYPAPGSPRGVELARIRTEEKRGRQTNGREPSSSAKGILGSRFPVPERSDAQALQPYCTQDKGRVVVAGCLDMALLH